MLKYDYYDVVHVSISNSNMVQVTYYVLNNLLYHLPLNLVKMLHNPVINAPCVINNAIEHAIRSAHASEKNSKCAHTVQSNALE